MSQADLITAISLSPLEMFTAFCSLGVLLRATMEIEPRLTGQNVAAENIYALVGLVPGKALEELVNDPNQRFLRRCLEARR